MDMFTLKNVLNQYAKIAVQYHIIYIFNIKYSRIKFGLRNLEIKKFELIREIIINNAFGTTST